VREAHPQVLLVEGFQAFHDPSLVSEMDLQLWLDVREGTARERRMRTSPVPPDYFEGAIWKEHVAYRQRVLGGGVVMIDAEDSPTAVLAEVLEHVNRQLGL